MARKKQKDLEVTNGVIKPTDNNVAIANESASNLIDDIRKLREAGLNKTPEYSKKMKELEFVLGVDRVSPFGTNELDLFENKLKDMMVSDMQAIARRIGVNPYLDKVALRNSLIREFKLYAKGNMRSVMPEATPVIVLDDNNPKHRALKDILRDN